MRCFTTLYFLDRAPSPTCHHSMGWGSPHQAPLSQGMELPTSPRLLLILTTTLALLAFIVAVVRLSEQTLLGRTCFLIV